MTQIATTIEQSKKLIELGINIDTADMRYEEIPGIQGEYKLVFSKPNSKWEIPAWSLSALMELMDDETSFTKEYTTWAVYDIRNIYRSENHLNPVDAAFEMVCYLLENNLVK